MTQKLPRPQAAVVDNNNLHPLQLLEHSQYNVHVSAMQEYAPQTGFNSH